MASAWASEKLTWKDTLRNERSVMEFEVDDEQSLSRVISQMTSNKEGNVRTRAKREASCPDSAPAVDDAINKKVK